MRRLSGAITGGLLLWAPLAALLGVLFAETGQRAVGLTPWLLAVMVFATSFTVPPARLLAALRRPERLLAVLLLQFGPLSLLALLFSRLPIGETAATGILVLGVAPSEITAGLMLLLAGGDVALGTAIVGASLLTGSIAAPWLLSIYAAGRVFVDRAALLQELTLCVGLPLIAASSLRGMLAMRVARAQAAASASLFEAHASHRAPAIGRFVQESAPANASRAEDLAETVNEQPAAPLTGRWAENAMVALDQHLPALAALAVLALLWIVAGTARSLLLDPSVVVIAALCLLMNLAGYVSGWAVFRLLGAPGPATRAAVFTTGMREFGVAATISAAVLPASAGVAGIYGILILFTAPALVWLWHSGAGR